MTQLFAPRDLLRPLGAPVPGVRFVEPVHTLIRVRAREKTLRRDLPRKKTRLDEGAVLDAVGRCEDFCAIHGDLGGDAEVDRDVLFQDLLNLERRGLVVGYGPDLWALVEATR